MRRKKEGSELKNEEQVKIEPQVMVKDEEMKVAKEILVERESKGITKSVNELLPSVSNLMQVSIPLSHFHQD